MTLKEFQSKGGKSHKCTEFAKDRARKAVNERWAKYYRKQREKGTSYLGSNKRRAVIEMRAAEAVATMTPIALD